MNQTNSFYKKYYKYKSKYVKQKITIGIQLYYGLYEIQYKINNDYKNSNDNFDSIINYLNKEDLANKCFNNCINIKPEEKKYCRKTNTKKCIPYCEKKDNICEKTTISINTIKTNIYNEKKINSKFNGLTNYIYKIIPIKLFNTIYFIVIIKNNLSIIIMFPSGYRYSKKEFEQTINFQSLYQQIFTKDIYEHEQIILCGHSMGSVLIQILLCDNILDDNLIKKCVIIGSGSYLWCENNSTIINFMHKFLNRYVFLGFGLFIFESKQIILDSYLFLSGKFDSLNKTKLYSFPTTFILEESLQIDNKILLLEKYTKLDKLFIISTEPKNTVYGLEIKKKFIEFNETTNIKPLDSLNIKNFDSSDIDLHTWNIYSKSIGNLL